jgi:hypothetical protein
MRTNRKTTMAKGASPAKPDDKDPEIMRLEEIDTNFVSLVGRGANRQDRFLLVKTAEVAPAVPDQTAATPAAPVSPAAQGDAALATWLEDMMNSADLLLAERALKSLEQPSVPAQTVQTPATSDPGITPPAQPPAPAAIQGQVQQDDALKAELTKANEEKAALAKQVEELRKSVAAPSALPTGEVTRPPSAGGIQGKASPTWRAGLDLSAEIQREKGANR